MKDRISELFLKSPKHYIRIIKKDAELMRWIEENSSIVSSSLKDKIYSILSGEPNICPYGKIKSVARLSDGYKNCGPASVCRCTKDEISNAVKLTKQTVTLEKQLQINRARSQTMIEKYGVEYNSQRLDIKHLWEKSKMTDYATQKLTDKNWLDLEYNVKKRTLVDIADELGVYYSTVGDYCRKFNFEIRQTTNYSLCEREIGDFIESLGFSCLRNNWTIIDKELDIVVLGKNLAIEVNGLYWHSYHPSSNKVENKNRHLEKTLAADSKNIQLLQFTDYEWYKKQSIVKAIIKSKLGLNTRIYARKCVLKDVTKSEEKEFINKYHIQGYIPSLKAVGLYFNEELVSLMSVGKSRFTDNAQYELLRYCTTAGITVVGGGSKMLKTLGKYFESIISYCDLSRSSGSGYLTMGFDEIRVSGPGYFWTDGNTIFSRYKCQKTQLKKWLSSFDNALSESENMFNSGFRRYHDCGNKVFLYKFSQQ